MLADLERANAERFMPLRVVDPLPDEVRDEHLKLTGYVPERLFVWPKAGVPRNCAWCCVKFLVGDTAGADIRKRHTKHYWTWYAAS